MQHDSLRVDTRRHAGVVATVSARDVLETKCAPAGDVVRGVEEAARHTAPVVLPEDVLRWMQKLTAGGKGEFFFQR